MESIVNLDRVKGWRPPPLFLILLFSLIVLGAGIGSSSLITQGDESDYIRSSQEMLVSGDLLSPTFRGELRFTKPPLLYWMVVASYEVFGVSLFTSRLPIVLCGLLTIFFVYRFALLLFDDRRVALLSALVTATSYGMVKFSKIVLMESPQTLTMLLAYYYFIRFYRENSKGFLLLSCIFIGLAGVLKSPLYSGICAAVMVLFLLMEGALKRIMVKEVLVGGVIVLLIVVPWYLIMIIKHGDLFTDFYYNEHQIKFLFVNQFLFRVWIGFFLYLLPWGLYLIYAGYRVGRDRLYREWPYKFLLIATVLFLAVFMIPHQKGLYYAIPVVPYGGILIGAALSCVLSHGEQPWKGWSLLTGLLLLVIGLILMGVIMIVKNDQRILLMVAPLLIVAAGVSFIWRSDKTVPIVLYGAALVPFHITILPTLNLPVIPVEQALAITDSRALYSYKLSPLRFSDALDQPVSEVMQPELLQRLIIKKNGVAIMTSESYDQLAASFKQATEIRMQWPRWRRRIPIEEVYDALLRRDLKALQEAVYLVERKKTVQKS